jgi:hypothetical protein
LVFEHDLNAGFIIGSGTESGAEGFLELRSLLFEMFRIITERNISEQKALLGDFVFLKSALQLRFNHGSARVAQLASVRIAVKNIYAAAVSEGGVGQ